jgi:hypothetical protein
MLSNSEVFANYLCQACGSGTCFRGSAAEVSLALQTTTATTTTTVTTTATTITNNSNNNNKRAQWTVKTEH